MTGGPVAGTRTGHDVAGAAPPDAVSPDVLLPDVLLPGVLRRRAVGDPHARAFVLLDEHGDEQATLTYRELYTRALATADRLGRRCGPGERALLVFPQGLEFIVAYFGCLYAHVIAVPVNPPRRGAVQNATRAIVRDCAPTAVLSTGSMIDMVRAPLEAVGGPLAWIAVDEIDPEPSPESAGATPPAVAAPADGLAADGMAVWSGEPDAVAFLQYTSGSTADPKGVMVTHRNLAANQEMIRHAFGHDRHSTFVGWAPLFHDQGLIGNVLQPLYLGATGVLLDPGAFIRRPLLWLATISRYRAHTSGGPNFAFDVCAAAAARGGVSDLDLSCWRVAFNGAEPIRADTLRRFADAFAPAGFDPRALYPCYGLAEATLLVTGSRKGRGPRTLDADIDGLGEGRYAPAPPDRGRTLVGSGLVPSAAQDTGAAALGPWAAAEVRIVDPETGRGAPPDRIGEIWVAGDHVAAGYWQRPQATAATFQARCADAPGRSYLRTGDLGLIVDGELYVVGRRKDMLVLRGRNHYPQDLEQTAVAAHPALRPGGCAAFAVPGAGGERPVIIQEVRGEPGPAADPADVAASIRAAVVREHDLTLADLVLVRPGALPKTSSGKIMRAAARRRYLAGDFAPWAASTLAAPPSSPAG